MKHNMDCVSVINVSFVSWILWYEMIIFPTWDTCICRCCPTLTVTGSYTDNISICVSCAEENIFIKNTSVPHISYVSDDIFGPLDGVIKYACNYDQWVWSLFTELLGIKKRINLQGWHSPTLDLFPISCDTWIDTSN